MASCDVSLNVRLEWENRKAISAFRKVVEVLEEIAEDFPYREDVQQAIRAGRYAANHIVVTAKTT